MQTFKVEKRMPKAILEIEDKKYEFYAPKTGDIIKYQKLLQENSDNMSAQSEIAIEYLASLSNASVEIIKGLDSELFDELFNYVITAQKKR